MVLGPIHDDEPQEGCFKRRMVKGGPWVPVRIWWHEGERDEAGDLLEDEGFRCLVKGRPESPYDAWVRLLPSPFEISEDEYHYLLRLCDWAEAHARNDAYANPRKAIDLNTMPPLF